MDPRTPTPLYVTSMSQTMVKWGVILIGIVAAFAGLYLFLLRVDTFLKNEAFYKCSQIAKYSVDQFENTTHVSYPLPETYNKCIQRFGF